ncbi:hypothetical protein BDR22DRAFT_854165 [Usnea florida]
MDWKGGIVGWESLPRFFYIDEFEGPMPITELPIYPLVFHPSRSELGQRLISRGKQFGAHRGYHLVHTMVSASTRGLGNTKFMSIAES